MWSEDCEGTGATAKLRLSDKVTRSSWTGTGTYRRALAVILGLAYFGLLGQAWRCQERPANAPAQSTVSEDLVLPDGTVLKLRLMEEVSSADARVGDAGPGAFAGHHVAMTGAARLHPDPHRARPGRVAPRRAPDVVPDLGRRAAAAHPLRGPARSRRDPARRPGAPP